MLSACLWLWTSRDELADRTRSLQLCKSRRAAQAVCKVQQTCVVKGRTLLKLPRLNMTASWQRGT